ncbi:DUF4839 domain-containing protein [Streptomyces sp. NPDC002734]|uniref:DUF4839 domain-containing protein n=1 Tax=Streptomyces sp. NPDC002734 TaxID=3154426 RepID=UPI0033206B7D
MADEIKYEYRTVQTVRGTDGLVTSRMQKDGWELVEQRPGTLRTTLNFRRPKKPLPWSLIGAGAAAFVLLAAVIGTGVALGDGDEEEAASADSTVASPAPSSTPTPPAAEPTASEVITAQNNPEFAALLKADSCGDENVDFAAKHEGQRVAFDGSIRHMAPYGDYETRYDFLLGTDAEIAHPTDGPGFKYENVNTGDLNLTGKDIPPTIGVGDKFRFVAEVVEFNPAQCLFYLSPVSTEVR